jgi:outer membrane protein insertion porin family
VVVAGWLALAATVPALAQDPAAPAPEVRAGLAARPITDIQVRGNQRVATDTIREAVKTQVGDMFNTESVSEDVRAIRNLGFFLDVAAKVEDFADGYRLIFEVVERPILAVVRFEGNKRVSTAKLQEATELRPGSYLDFYLLGVAEDRVHDLYVELGYQFAQVTKELTEADNQYTAVFHITEGPRVRIKAVQFEGNAAFPDRKLRSLLQTQPYFLILSKGVYDPSTLETDLLRVSQFYAENGYLDVAVDRELTYSEDKTQLTITITVHEGVRYQVTEIVLTGNQAVLGRDIREQLALREGDYFTQEGHQENFRRISRLYGPLGYLVGENLRITPRLGYGTEPGKVTVEYRLEEGAPLYVDEVRVVGNYKTRDRVVRRDLTFHPGEILDANALQESLDRLRGRGFYEKVRLDLLPGSTPDSRAVVVTVDEARTAFFSFGAGISSNSGLIGNISFTQHNFDWTRVPANPDELFSGSAFAGGGQQLSLQFEPGTQLSMLRLDFLEPSVFDQPYSFGLSAFLFERRREDYNESRRGGSISLGHRFTPELSLAGTLKAETVELTDIDPTTAPDILALQGTNDLISLRLALTYDRRDSFWQPSRGYMLEGYFEQYGTFLGGDFDFWKSGAQAQYFRTLLVDRFDRKHILAVTGEANFAHSYNDMPVPIFERYFAGGAYSARGFQYRGIGPHFGDQPLGGEARLLASAEYTFPLIGEFFRGLLFLDAADLGSTAAGFGSLRTAVGFGLRISAPGLGPLPISLDFGFPLTKEDEDITHVFSFSIGAYF